MPSEVTTDNVLDLNALAPKQGRVLIGDKTLIVSPPKFDDLVKLLDVYTRVTTNIELTDSASLNNQLKLIRKALQAVIPDLKDATITLNVAQIKALLEFVFNMAKPTDAKELEKAGIEPDVAEKKIPEPPSSN